MEQRSSSFLSSAESSIFVSLLTSGEKLTLRRISLCVRLGGPCPGEDARALMQSLPPQRREELLEALQQQRSCAALPRTLAPPAGIASDALRSSPTGSLHTSANLGREHRRRACVLGVRAAPAPGHRPSAGVGGVRVVARRLCIIYSHAGT